MKRDVNLTVLSDFGDTRQYLDTGGGYNIGHECIVSWNAIKCGFRHGTKRAQHKI